MKDCKEIVDSRDDHGPLTGADGGGIFGHLHSPAGVVLAGPPGWRKVTRLLEETARPMAPGVTSGL